EVGIFSPNEKSNDEAIKKSTETIEAARYNVGDDIQLAMDVAASEIYEDSKYNLKGEGVDRTSAEMVDWYETLVDKFPILSIEDGLDEDDWEGHKMLTERIGSKVQLVGDDLF